MDVICEKVEFNIFIIFYTFKRKHSSKAGQVQILRKVYSYTGEFYHITGSLCRKFEYTKESLLQFEEDEKKRETEAAMKKRAGDGGLFGGFGGNVTITL